MFRKSGAFLTGLSRASVRRTYADAARNTVWRVAQAIIPKIASFPRAASEQTARLSEREMLPIPIPRAAGGMCEAQRIDLEAAIEGKITWAQYFAKWGGNCTPRSYPLLG